MRASAVSTHLYIVLMPSVLVFMLIYPVTQEGRGTERWDRLMFSNKRPAFSFPACQFQRSKPHAASDARMALS
jgi:hypothetical protein